jgi:hypothetical protein
MRFNISRPATSTTVAWKFGRLPAMQRVYTGSKGLLMPEKTHRRSGLRRYQPQFLGPRRAGDGVATGYVIGCVCLKTIGCIGLGTKQTDASSAGKPLDGCNGARTGNEITVWPLTHSQRKGDQQPGQTFRTAPVLDPTAKFPHSSAHTFSFVKTARNHAYYESGCPSRFSNCAR